MRRRSFLLGAGATGVSLVLPTSFARAQAYPSKPIRFVIPYPPGGVTDISARLLAATMGRILGQPWIPENKPGAGGNIAAQYVAHAAPDGYTILFATSGSHGVNPSLYKNIPFDPIKDFTPIVYTSSSPNIFVANKNFPGNTIADFIELARSKPSQLTMGLGSLGTSQHMAAELLRYKTKTDFITVPYRGGALALQDLVGGQIQTLIDGFPSSIQYVKQGTIKALAVTSIDRVPSAPNIPATSETIPGFSTIGWFGLAGPAGLPAEIVEKLNKAANEALADPGLRKKYIDFGAKLQGGTPQAFADHIKSEIGLWSAVVKATGAKVE